MENKFEELVKTFKNDCHTKAHEICCKIHNGETGAYMGSHFMVVAQKLVIMACVVINRKDRVAMIEKLCGHLLDDLITLEKIERKADRNGTPDKK
ncbi:hypothetical protein LCGC14_0452190 [marine sediment metagenome]|uniref:Uncharacterized protein n=1 Tax=marine sediment metagenome TaxID=412755 RepID=A0A0F9VRH0_9ZZZZ